MVIWWWHLMRLKRFGNENIWWDGGKTKNLVLTMLRLRYKWDHQNGDIKWANGSQGCKGDRWAETEIWELPVCFSSQGIYGMGWLRESVCTVCREQFWCDRELPTGLESSRVKWDCFYFWRYSFLFIECCELNNMPIVANKLFNLNSTKR